MAKITVNIEGMTCQHCVGTVTNTLKELSGVQDTSVDLAGKKARVEYDDAEIRVAEIKKAIEDAGYEVKGIDQ